MKPPRTLSDHPEGSLLNPDFRYVPAAATDLRARFARMRKELGQPAPKRAPQPARRSIERARRELARGDFLTLTAKGGTA